MKPKIIAFSWVWNTGKSYTLNKLEETWKYVKYWEIARELFDVLEKDWMKAFQQAILEQEKKRLFDLMTYTGKKDIIIDRTFSDQMVYYYWNLIKGKIEDEFDFWTLADYLQSSKELYDEVVLFTEPFKTSKNFEFYNDEKLAILMNTTIRTIYWDKVKEYKNSYDYFKHNKI